METIQSLSIFFNGRGKTTKKVNWEIGVLKFFKQQNFVYIYVKAQKKPSEKSKGFLKYLEWESNPHTEVHEFESCASTNSAIQAINLLSIVGAKVTPFF